MSLRSGEVKPRPGVLQLMDAARAAGLKVAVCSAATKSSVVFTLKSLLGEQRFSSLDCFLAGEAREDSVGYLRLVHERGEVHRGWID